MSGDGKNLQGILTEVVGDTVGNADSQSQDTTGGNSADGNGDTQSGGTPKPEFVGGIDISDIPEQDRPRIKELLGRKMSAAEKGINEKNQALNAKSKELDDLIAKAKTSTTTQAQPKAQAVKMLDKLIDSAPSEQQSALQQMRQIIMEETEVGELKKQLKELSDFVQVFAQDKTISRQGQLSTELDGLRERYGTEIIDKYKDDIVKQGIKFNATARQLLHAIVPPEELEQALLKPAKKATTTKEKINSVSSSGSGITSSKETLNTKQPLKALISELMKT